MLIIKAINFASTKHKGQERRDSGLPYVTHPIIVSHLIGKYKGDSSRAEELQVAALLHDVIEDTGCDRFEIEREFGSLVASIVMELTSDEYRIKEVGKNEYLKTKMVTMSKYAFILKLVDRLANVSDAPGPGYIKHTLNMMTYLRTHRPDITERQLRIIDDIEKVCHDFQDKD